MNLTVRDGNFDVVIAAGPRVEVWPSIGVRTLSTLCAELGLSVAQYGRDTCVVRGMAPLRGSGGLVLIEDSQKRIHRIKARSIVRFSAEPQLPDPFLGWFSQGLIPLLTAEKLWKENLPLWEPLTVILGTGNRALRFGSTLLESGMSEVICVEPFAQWKAKRFAGWEVDKRRFEMAGGKLIEAKPIQLIPKGPYLWQLRLQDAQGIRLLEVGRVVSAGPFASPYGIREYPSGSLLFEVDQTASQSYTDNVEGWNNEEESGKWLAGKIIKSLISDLGKNKEHVDRIFQRARRRLKNFTRHQELPFTPSYQGKWLSIPDSKSVKTFSGVPQTLHHQRGIASIECFEEISCNKCQTVCPTSAIQLGRVPRNKSPILTESACISCGQCVIECPSSAIVMLQEKEQHSLSQITLPWRGKKNWSEGELATLINRRGETLGSARVIKVAGMAPPPQQIQAVQLVSLEAPTHLIWEARGIKRVRPGAISDTAYLSTLNKSQQLENKVEIFLNGEKRLVRDRVSISTALFELGHNRPEDILFCKDGSCGLCHVLVDSVKKLACQTRTHKGMSIKISDMNEPSTTEEILCPCLGITKKQVTDRIHQGKLQSAEAVLSVTHVGEGKCHGLLCMDAFKRLLFDYQIPISHWIDWRSPWMDWTLSRS